MEEGSWANQSEGFPMRGEACMVWLGFFCGSLGEVDRGQERTRILSPVRLLSMTSQVPYLHLTLGRWSVFDAHLYKILILRLLPCIAIAKT